jgi:metal-responsive CopG/Arc/MetJ family transcriptional regulator
MKEKKNIPLIIKLDKVLHKKLNKYVEDNCLNKSAFVRKLIEDKINEEK